MKNYINLILILFTTIFYAQDSYLHCGKIIDTKNGKVLNDKTIIVSSNKIVSIKNGFVKPKNSNDIIIDLKTKTVMPGLIDLHVHIESEFNPQKIHECIYC